MSEQKTGFKKLAVIGAGNMGSGIAQKDGNGGLRRPCSSISTTTKVAARHRHHPRRRWREGVERQASSAPGEAEEIQSRVSGSGELGGSRPTSISSSRRCSRISEVKRHGVRRVWKMFVARTRSWRPTLRRSSCRIFADTAKHPERIVLGLHYFYHPAKNRLVEVVPGNTDLRGRDASRAWTLQELIGKTPIASADRLGLRRQSLLRALAQRGGAPAGRRRGRHRHDRVGLPKKTFRIGMGPFELMNVTGVPIAFHAATTLGGALRTVLRADRSACCGQQVESGEPWDLDGEADESNGRACRRTACSAVTFYVAAALVDEGVGTIEDTDIGARVGLRWPQGSVRDDQPLWRRDASPQLVARLYRATLEDAETSRRSLVRAGRGR